jgi:hypothetical protein
MKIITLLAFTIFALSGEASSRNELNFKETVKVKKVVMNKELPTNLASLFKDRPDIKMATLR